MKREDEKMELEKEAPILASINKKNVFETPEGYFNNLSEQILNQIEINQLVGNENNFKVPEDYFDNLTQQIQSATYLTANAEGDGFNVPANYFNQAQERILDNAFNKPKASKVIKLHFVRYAAAACILLTTTLGIYFNIKQNTSIDNQLSKIPAKEIESYLNQHIDGGDLPILIENIDGNKDLTIEDFNLETLE